jgi:hypothetical protein
MQPDFSPRNSRQDRFLACADWINARANLKIYGLRWTCLENARLDAEFEEKMRNLEKAKEESEANRNSLLSGFTKNMYEGLIFYFEMYSPDFKDAIYNHSPIPKRRPRKRSRNSIYALSA